MRRSLSAVASGSGRSASACSSGCGAASSASVFNSGCGAAGAGASACGASFSTGISGRLMVSSLPGRPSAEGACGFSSSSALPKKSNPAFFSGGSGCFSAAGGCSSAVVSLTDANTADGSGAPSGCGSGCCGAGAASAVLGAGSLLLRPLSMALNWAIFFCSCSSCGSRTSGAFLGFFFLQPGFGASGCCSAGAALCLGGSGFFSGAGGSGCGAGSGAFSGSGCFCSSSACGSSRKVRISGSGSAVGFSTSSRSASGSGSASLPSSTSPVGISSGRSADSSACCFALPRPNRPNRFCGFSSGSSSSRRAMASGISTAVVLKKERNFSSGVISRLLFLSFGILVPPVDLVEVPAFGPVYACCAAR